jgi:hypothetical protein
MSAQKNATEKQTKNSCAKKAHFFACSRAKANSLKTRVLPCTCNATVFSNQRILKNTIVEFRAGFVSVTFVDATSRFAHGTRMCSIPKMDP